MLKSLKPNCGDCIGFCNERLKSSKSNCMDMGIVETSEICSSFQPNVNNIRDCLSNDGGFITLARIVDKLPDSSLRTFGAMLMREDRTRKAGYKMGQVVYVRYRGLANSNYISNFMKAHILFVDSKTYKLMSRDGSCVLTFSSECKPHILNKQEFQCLRDSMIEKGRLVDPDVNRLLSRKLRAEEDYELGITKESKNGIVTTIDTVFKENRLPKRGSINDLRAIVSHIEKGYDVRESAEVYRKTKKSSKNKKDIISVDVSY